jgi:ribonuclease R
MQVQVKLAEATPITGGLLFEMLSEPAAADPTAPRPRLGMRARGDRRPGGAFRGPPRQGQPGRPKNIRNGRKKGGPRR